MVDVILRADAWEVCGEPAADDPPDVRLVAPTTLLEQELLRGVLSRRLQQEWMPTRPPGVSDEAAASFRECLDAWLDYAGGGLFHFDLESGDDDDDDDDGGGGGDHDECTSPRGPGSGILVGLSAWFDPDGIERPRPEYHFAVAWVVAGVAGTDGPFGSDDASAVLDAMYGHWFRTFGHTL